MRIRVFSDLHLGHRLTRIESVEALRPLLVGVDQAIFNGDTWQEISLNTKEIDHSGGWLGALRDLCRECEVEPVFLSGNHDPSFAQSHMFFQKQCGLIMHGDALMRAGSPWKREVIADPETVSAIWAAHPEAGMDINERFAIAKALALQLPTLGTSKRGSFFARAWDAACPPTRALWMLYAWTFQARLAVKFITRYAPQLKWIIIGHFHRRGIWKIGERYVINTGSFMNPGKACVVDIESDQLSVFLVNESDPTAYAFGQKIAELPLS